MSLEDTIKPFLAPTGAQEVTLSVRPPVCDNVEFFTESACNLQRSLSGLSAVSQWSLSGFSAVSQRFLSSLLVVSQHSALSHQTVGA